MKPPIPPSIKESRPATLQWAGEELVLLPERALWWKRMRTLFLADPHFGKASAFRAAGLPVPELSQRGDLARLELILMNTGVAKLVILGDFFHAKTGRSQATLSALAAWRQRQASLEMILVLGNHDQHAGTPPKEWEIQCVNGPWLLPPFQCFHEPPEKPKDFSLAGHLHPSFHLRERIGSGLRGPCFHFGARVAVLPAFGGFTGTRPIRPKSGDRVFMIGPEEVIEVTPRRR